MEKLDEDFIENCTNSYKNCATKDEEKQFISLEEYKNWSNENWNALEESRNQLNKRQADFKATKKEIRVMIYEGDLLPQLGEGRIEIVMSHFDCWDFGLKYLEISQQKLDEEVEAKRKYRELAKKYLINTKMLIQKPNNSVERQPSGLDCFFAFINGFAVGIIICIVMICTVVNQQKTMTE